MKTLLVLLCMCMPVHATDRYFSATGNDANPGTMASPYLTPTKAIAAWLPGDRLWFVGTNYKLLMSWDASDPELTGTPPVVIPQTADVLISFKPGGKLQNLTLTRRTTDIGTTMQCRVNKSTLVVKQ